jgi:hypothetical protein
MSSLLELVGWAATESLRDRTFVGNRKRYERCKRLRLFFGSGMES